MPQMFFALQEIQALGNQPITVYRFGTVEIALHTKLYKSKVSQLNTTTTEEYFLCAFVPLQTSPLQITSFTFV